MSAAIRPKSVKAHKLRDHKLQGWEKKASSPWGYREILADPTWHKGWISFDSLTFNPYDKKVYCGLNTLDSDLLYTFDPKTELFESMGAQSWADQFDVKIHRTLLLNPKDRCFYFGTGLLHDVEQQQEAKGGKLVRFDPQTRTYRVIAVPVPLLYIQSIAADWERDIVYGFTYPAEAAFRTNLADGSSRILAYIGNSVIFVQAHNPMVDKYGWLWGTYADIRAWDETDGPEPVRLFKYHPEGNRFVYFEHGLPRKASSQQLLTDPPQPAGVSSAMAETRHKNDFGFCDSMRYDGNRYIYAGTTAGVLARIDVETGQVVKLANVVTSGRLPALAIKDGILYGAGGMKGDTQLVRWDIRTDKMEGYTDLVDPKINERPARIHELDVDDEHRVYLGENDNPDRSCYLWTAQLK